VWRHPGAEKPRRTRNIETSRKKRTIQVDVESASDVESNVNEKKRPGKKTETEGCKTFAIKEIRASRDGKKGLD